MSDYFTDLIKWGLCNDQPNETTTTESRTVPELPRWERWHWVTFSVCKLVTVERKFHVLRVFYIREFFEIVFWKFASFFHKCHKCEICFCKNVQNVFHSNKLRIRSSFTFWIHDKVQTFEIWSVPNWAIPKSAWFMHESVPK